MSDTTPTPDDVLIRAPRAGGDAEIAATEQRTSKGSLMTHYLPPRDTYVAPRGSYAVPVAVSQLHDLQAEIDTISDYIYMVDDTSPDRRTSLGDAIDALTRLRVVLRTFELLAVPPAR